MDLIGDNRINYGIALLKMLMCFEVVLIHFWKGRIPTILLPFSMAEGLAVPSFMFLSFYYSKNTFLSVDSNKAKKRICRIIYPHVGWAFIYWFIYIILQSRISVDITLKDLFWQILTGHSPKLNPSMWFQTVLIVLTFIILLSFKLLKERNGLILFFFLTLFSLWFQYSGYNLRLFNPLRYELKYPLGRLCEMLPYASLGFFVAYFDVYNRLKKHRTLFVILFGCVSLLLFKFNSIIPSSTGFGYSHNNNLLHVFFIVGFAFLLPFERFSQRGKQIIYNVSRYTLGIYCMHRLVAFFMNKTLTIIGFELKSFMLCIIIYIVCFCSSYAFCRLSSKYLKPLVE